MRRGICILTKSSSRARPTATAQRPTNTHHTDIPDLGNGNRRGTHPRLSKRKGDGTHHDRGCRSRCPQQRANPSLSWLQPRREDRAHTPIPLRFCCSRSRLRSVLAVHAQMQLREACPCKALTRATVKRMDNVGIVVEDIDAAIEFFMASLDCATCASQLP